MLSIDLTVADIQASAEFFRRLGLNVPDVWEQDGVPHHVQIEGCLMLNSIALTAGYDPSWSGTGAVYIVHVPTRDAVDAKVVEMKDAGYTVHLEPLDAFWGARYAIIDDPDGNLIGIMSPQDGEHGEPVTA